MFFQTPTKMLFVSPLARPRAPKSRRIEFVGRFWEPPRNLRVLKIGQKTRPVLRNAALGTDLVPRSRSKRSWVPFLQMFSGFWTIWGLIFSIFDKFVYCFCANCYVCSVVFHHKQSPPTPPKSTEVNLIKLPFSFNACPAKSHQQITSNSKMF